MTIRWFKKLILASTFLTALALAACESVNPLFVSPSPTPVTPTPTPVPMAVMVNGEGITLAEFEAELARYQTAQAALGNEVSLDDAASYVMEDLINQTLLAQGARDSGFVLEDGELQARFDSLAEQVGGRDQLAQWLVDNGYTQPDFLRSLERDITAAWMRDQILASVASTAEQVHVRQILLYNPDTAQEVLANLNAGMDFNVLAARYDSIAQGELGWFPRGYLPEPAIEQAAFALQPGQFSGVIETEIGYHILFVVERDPVHLLSPDALLALQSLALENWLIQQRGQGTIILAP